MLIRQIDWPIKMESRTRLLAEGLRKDRNAVIAEGDQTAIEYGIPKSRQKQAIMDIQTLGVVFTVAPWLDVRGTEKRLVDNPGQRASPPPVFDQTLTKDVLADTLDHKAFRLRRFRQVLCTVKKLLKWCVGKACGKLVNPWHHAIKLCQRGKAEPCEAGSCGIGRLNPDLCNDPGVIQGEELRTGSVPSEPDRPLRGRRTVPLPAIEFAMGAPEAILVGDLVAFLAAHEGLGAFKHHPTTSPIPTWRMALQQPCKLTEFALKPRPVFLPVGDGKSLVAATAPQVCQHFQMLVD